MAELPEPTYEELAEALTQSRGDLVKALDRVAELEAQVEDLENAVTEPSERATRYAVYDLRFLKYVGNPSEKKPSKAATKDLVGHDDFEIREV